MNAQEESATSSPQSQKIDENTKSNTKVNATINDDPIIKSESHDHEIGNDKILTTKETKSIVESNRESASLNLNDTRSKIELYLNALVHSTHCTLDSCTFNKCLQFKRVTQHNKSCQKFIHDGCEFCRQLIAISVYHAKNCSNNSNCLVPFCSTIKQKLGMNKSIKFVTDYLTILQYKLKHSQSTQTFTSEYNTNKRKLWNSELNEFLLENNSEIEKIENNSLLIHLEDSIESKNVNVIQMKEKFNKKITEINEKINSNESNRFNQESNHIKLNKLNREKLISTLIHQTISQNPLLKTSSFNYANLIACILRKETEINKSTDPDDYLYLITDMFNCVLKEMNKYKPSQCTGSQIDACESAVSSTSNEEFPNKRSKIQ